MAARQLTAALQLVEQRLREAPDDFDARGWRARLLAWTNCWTEAEAEYRRILQSYPDDSDVLVGLADVLAWQHRYDEALAALDRAQQQSPERPDVYVRRGRLLRSLRRTQEARRAFLNAFQLDPTSAEARAGLRSLEPQPRHEFRIGTDFDHFRFTQDAQSVTTALRSRWSAHWETAFAGNFQHRFGQQAGRFLASTTFRPTQSDAVIVGGGAGHDAGILPKGEAFFEYTHGFRLEDHRFLRGAELGCRQQWLWYRDARLLVLMPHTVLYFPRNWYWTLSVSAARSRFPGTSAEWRPSGITRLHFPLGRLFAGTGRLGGNLFFGVGTENFAQADQVGRFSARTFGGGLRWQVNDRQDLGGFVFYQDRSQGRMETGFGFSYGIRF